MFGHKARPVHIRRMGARRRLHPVWLADAASHSGRRLPISFGARLSDHVRLYGSDLSDRILRLGYKIVLINAESFEPSVMREAQSRAGTGLTSSRDKSSRDHICEEAPASKRRFTNVRAAGATGVRVAQEVVEWRSTQEL
jgi:hypothetical protein